MSIRNLLGLAAALQVSGDDNPCLITLDTTDYCLGMGSGYDLIPTNRVAIPAP